MKKNDIIFAIICGLAVSWLTVDFFGTYGLIFIIIFPLLSVLGLWITEVIGKKIPFIHQAGKFGLAGAFADVIDIKVFQLLFWLVPFSLLFKAVSFLIATFAKYWLNKTWAFHNGFLPNGKKPYTEAAIFFLVTLVGLGINVVSFYYFGKIKVGLPVNTWTELSIILAALVSAIWNFAGYKFLVFKK